MSEIEILTEGTIQFHVSVRVDMTEFAGWKADRITAFFGGIAQVLAAKGDLEKPLIRQPASTKTGGSHE